MNNDDLRRLKLGDLLVKAGVITAETLGSALAEQKVTKMRLGETLIKNGWIKESQLAEALSRQLKLPLVALGAFTPSKEALRIIPENLAQRLEIVPLAVLDSGKIAIAMSDPFNVIAVDELRMITNAEFEINVATISDIRRALLNFYKVQVSLDDAISEVSTNVDDFSKMIVGGGTTQDVDIITNEDAPVVRLVSNILEQAVKDGASDVHVEPFEKNSKVRYRIDGALFEYMEYPANLHPAVVSRLKIISNMDISERRKPQDGRILLKISGRKIDLRVNSLPAIYGEKVVMRLLDQTDTQRGLGQLGIFDDDIASLKRMIKAPHGIFLLTGPTGSGKSTTLYSLLDVLNTPDVNIITVEDPVEYTIAGINQVQVNEKVGLTFTESLRSILRQDPDKIMVGEIRDYPTAELAIRAALTGHLVLSTLHTNDAPSSILRLEDMGVPSFMISASMVAIVAQRLLKRLCKCKTEHSVTEHEASVLGVPAGTVVYAPGGCELCRNTGYKGRIAIVEIMEISDKIRSLINKGAQVDEIRKEACANGMRTLGQSATRIILEGVTSIEEMLNLSVQRD